MQENDEFKMVELDDFELANEVTQVNEQDDFVSNTSFWAALPL